jgi:hypothetical protein
MGHPLFHDKSRGRDVRFGASSSPSSVLGIPYELRLTLHNTSTSTKCQTGLQRGRCDAAKRVWETRVQRFSPHLDKTMTLLWGSEVCSGKTRVRITMPETTVLSSPAQESFGLRFDGLLSSKYSTPLLTVQEGLPIAHCPLPIVHCPLPIDAIAHYSPIQCLPLCSTAPHTPALPLLLPLRSPMAARRRP